VQLSGVSSAAMRRSTDMLILNISQFNIFTLLIHCFAISGNAALRNN
jgi:hypothetical protein